MGRKIILYSSNTNEAVFDSILESYSRYLQEPHFPHSTLSAWILDIFKQNGLVKRGADIVLAKKANEELDLKILYLRQAARDLEIIREKIIKDCIFLPEKEIEGLVQTIDRHIDFLTINSYEKRG